MAGGYATARANAVLDGTLGGPQLSLPATVYAAAITSADTKAQRDAGTFTEATGNGYARVAITNNVTNFPAGASGSKSNGVVITFPTPTPLGYGDILGVYLMDASTAGNPLQWADCVGVEKEFTADSTDVITSAAHGLVQHDRIKVTVPIAGSLPAGLTDGAYYYVIAGGLTTDAFKVSTTDGGSAVDITGPGSGVWGKDQRVTTNANVPPQINVGQLTFTLASS